MPVIGVAWSYTNLSPDQMAARIITPYERSISTTVNNVQHIESQSLLGIGIVKIYFQPDVDIRTATAQVTSISQTVLRQLPPGTTPPLILNYDASTVPVLQVVTSSRTFNQQQLFDLTQNFMRPTLTTVAGTAIPYAYGGQIPQIQVDLNPQALQARGLSAQDVQNAIANQNQILPAGTVKIGSLEYTVNRMTRRQPFRRSTTCRSRQSMARPSMCGTWPMCGMARRRRRTSCMSTIKKLFWHRF